MCFLSMLLRMALGRHVAVILHLAFVASCLLNIPNLPDIIVILLLGRVLANEPYSILSKESF